MYIAKRYQQNHMEISWGHIWFMIPLRYKTNINYWRYNDIRQKGKHIVCSLSMFVKISVGSKKEGKAWTQFWKWGGFKQAVRSRQGIPDREKSGADVERHKLTFCLGRTKHGEQGYWPRRSQIFMFVKLREMDLWWLSLPISTLTALNL